MYLLYPVLYETWKNRKVDLKDEDFYSEDWWKLFGQRYTNSTTLFGCLVIFAYLVYLMKNYHRLEYETKIRQFVVFFTNFIILICCLTVSTEVTNTRLVNTPDLCFFRKPELVFIEQQSFWLYVIGWMPLWLCFTLLYLKSD